MDFWQRRNAIVQRFCRIATKRFVTHFINIQVKECSGHSFVQWINVVPFSCCGLTERPSTRPTTKKLRTSRQHRTCTHHSHSPPTDNTMSDTFLFTSESVNEGHPGTVAISRTCTFRISVILRTTSTFPCAQLLCKDVSPRNAFVLHVRVCMHLLRLYPCLNRSHMQIAAAAFTQSYASHLQFERTPVIDVASAHSCMSTCVNAVHCVCCCCVCVCVCVCVWFSR